MEKIIQELEAKRAAARRGYLICAAMGVALVVMLGTHQYTRALAVLALTVIAYFLLEWNYTILRLLNLTGGVF